MILLKAGITLFVIVFTHIITCFLMDSEPSDKVKVFIGVELMLSIMLSAIGIVLLIWGF